MFYNSWTCRRIAVKKVDLKLFVRRFMCDGSLLKLMDRPYTCFRVGGTKLAKWGLGVLILSNNLLHVHSGSLLRIMSYSYIAQGSCNHKAG